MKEKLLHSWNYLRVKVGVPLIILIFLSFGFFFYSTVRDWFTQRMIEQHTERVEQYNRQAQEFIKTAEKFLEKADESRADTIGLLEEVRQMNVSIQDLEEHDRKVAVKVNNSGKDYENTRNQTRSSTANARANLPLRKREDDVLSRDGQLFKDR